MDVWIAWAKANQTVLLIAAAVLVVAVPRLWTWLASSGGSSLEWLGRLVPKAAEPTPAAKRARAIAAFDTLDELLPQCQDVLHTTIWPQIGLIDRPKATMPQHTYTAVMNFIPQGVVASGPPEAKP